MVAFLLSFVIDAHASPMHFTAPARRGDVDVVLQGDDPSVVRALADAVVADLSKEHVIASAADGERAVRDFMAPRLWLFMSLAELRALRDEVDTAWDWEVSHEMGTALDDGPPPLIDTQHHARDWKTWLEERTSNYFESDAGHVVVVAVHPRADGVEALRAARAVVTRALANARFTSVHASFVGDPVRAVATHAKHREELTIAIVALLILAVAVAIAKRRISRQSAVVAVACIALACVGSRRLYAASAADVDIAPSEDATQKARAILGPEVDVETTKDATSGGERARTLRARGDVAEAASLLDFVPPDQQAKLEHVAALADHVEAARRHQVLVGEQWEKFRPFAPSADLKPFGAEDLPPELVASFTRDARGDLVFVAHK